MERLLRSFRLKKPKHEESDSKRSMRDPRISGDPHSQPSDIQLPPRQSITPEHHSGPAYLSSDSRTRQNLPNDLASPSDSQLLINDAMHNNLKRSASAKRRHSQENELANNSGSKDDSSVGNRKASGFISTKPKPEVSAALNTHRVQSSEASDQHLSDHQSIRVEDPSFTQVGAQHKPLHKLLPLDLSSKFAFNHHSHQQSSNSQSQRQSAQKMHPQSDRRKHSIPSGAAVVASHEFECYIPPAMPSDAGSRAGPGGEPSRFAPGRRSARAATSSTQGTTIDLGLGSAPTVFSCAVFYSSLKLPVAYEYA